MFLFAAEELNETRLAKLSPVEGAGLEGDGVRFDAADMGVDLPEPPFDRILGNRPELIGGGLFGGAFELLDQLRPFKSSMAG
jgi:hypothetical protein